MHRSARRPSKHGYSEREHSLCNIDMVEEFLVVGGEGGGDDGQWVEGWVALRNGEVFAQFPLDASRDRPAIKKTISTAMGRE